MPTVVIEQPEGGALLPVATAATTNGATVITGRVLITGHPPQESTYTIYDPSCGPGNGGKFTTRNFLVSHDGGLANVFMHIRLGLKGKAFPVPASTVLYLSNCLFEPYIFGLMTNQTLQIQNLDKGTEPVDFLTYAGVSLPAVTLGAGKSASWRFPTPDTFVKVINQKRSLVRSYACIVDNPFFAVTDANGNFSISNVPPGDYVLEAYHALTHRGKPGVMQSVSVTAGATVNVDFTIQDYTDVAPRQIRREKPLVKN